MSPLYLALFVANLGNYFFFCDQLRRHVFRALDFSVLKACLGMFLIVAFMIPTLFVGIGLIFDLL